MHLHEIHYRLIHYAINQVANRATKNHAERKAKPFLLRIFVQ